MPSSCCFCPGCKSGYASDTKRGKNSGETLPNLFRSPKSILITRILHEILSKLFLLLGSFGVEHFASLRYEFRKNELLSPENLDKYGIKKKKVTLEEEYEKIKKLDIDSWENIRGPRPWEEPRTTPSQKIV